MKTDRWSQAQGYEKQWWDNRKGGMNLAFYKDYADDVRQQLSGILPITKETRILEIGSGAAGILTFLNSDHRFAIDPLESFYSSVEQFSSFRDPAVQYFTGKGEDLPFDANAFDLIIMDNVLDHCDDTKKVLQEIVRVLKPNGIVYFRQNVYHVWGKFIRQLMELLVIDKGHPHTFTYLRMKKLLVTQNLTIVRTERSGFFRRWKYELFAGTKNDFIKAVLFVNRDKVMFILKK